MYQLWCETAVREEAAGQVGAGEERGKLGPALLDHFDLKADPLSLLSHDLLDAVYKPAPLSGGVKCNHIMTWPKL